MSLTLIRSPFTSEDYEGAGLPCLNSTVNISQLTSLPVGSLFYPDEDFPTSTDYLNLLLERRSTQPPAPWIPDIQAKNCFCCGDIFSFSNRKHHCRACGSVVCSFCSANQISIPSMGYRNPVRVCDCCMTCHKILCAGKNPEKVVSFANLYLCSDKVYDFIQHSKADFIEMIQDWILDSTIKSHRHIEYLTNYDQHITLNAWNAMLQVAGVGVLQKHSSSSVPNSPKKGKHPLNSGSIESKNSEITEIKTFEFKAKDESHPALMLSQNILSELKQRQMAKKTQVSGDLNEVPKVDIRTEAKVKSPPTSPLFIKKTPISGELNEDVKAKVEPKQDVVRSDGLVGESPAGRSDAKVQSPPISPLLIRKTPISSETETKLVRVSPIKEAVLKSNSKSNNVSPQRPSNSKSAEPVINSSPKSNDISKFPDTGGLPSGSSKNQLSSPNPGAQKIQYSIPKKKSNAFKSVRASSLPEKAGGFLKDKNQDNMDDNDELISDTEDNPLKPKLKPKSERVRYLSRLLSKSPPKVPKKKNISLLQNDMIIPPLRIPKSAANIGFNETRKRRSTILDSIRPIQIPDNNPESKSLLPDANSSPEHIVNKLHEIRLYGAVFMVKEPSNSMPSVFHRRLLIITPDSEVILTGPLRTRTRRALLTQKNIKLSLRLCIKVRVIESEMIQIEASNKKSVKPVEPSSRKNFGHRSWGNIASLDSSAASPCLMKLLVINLKSRNESPVKLIILNEEGNPDDSSLEECLQVLSAHRRQLEHRAQLLLRSIYDKFELAQEKVDWANETHEELFKRLWRALRQDPFPGKKDKKWTELGFQGMDPQTDFRGSGVLGLKALVHWSEVHKHFAHELYSLQSERSYPLCTAGINCVSLVLRLLVTDSSSQSAFGLLPKFNLESVQSSDLFRFFLQCSTDRDIFYEIFVMLLRKIDQYSVAMKAGYLDFPQVVQAVETDTRCHLTKEPCDVTTLQKWIQPK